MNLLPLASHPRDVEDSFEGLFRDNPFLMCFYDPATLEFVEANLALLMASGYTRDEFVRLKLSDVCVPDDALRLHETVRTVQSGTASRRCSPVTRWRYRCKDGRTLWMDVYGTAVLRAGRQLRLMTAIDVTELHRSAEQVQQQTAYFRQLFQNSPDATLMLDHEDRVLDANRAFEELFQYSLAELRGRLINEVIVPAERHDEASRLSQTALQDQPVVMDTVRQRKDGIRVEVTTHGYPITVEGKRVGVFAIYRDNSQVRRIAEGLARQAIHDPLTGLVNRQEFERSVQVQTRRGQSSVLLSVDVDRFKMVNDGLGSGAGDQLLVELAAVLQGELRSQDVLSRLGGDKFGVLLVRCSTEEGRAVAQRMIEAVGQHRFHWQDRNLVLGISVGLAALTEDSRDVGERMRAADTACLAAKEQGRGRVHSFRPGDEALSRRASELDWATRITESLEQGRYRLYAQKIASLNAPDSGTRCEILLRLLDAEDRIVLPGPFVAAAERYGLMPEVDRRLVAEVIARLHAHAVAGRPLPASISVNLSGASVSEEGLGAFIREQLEKHPIPANILCFEITETAAIANMGRALNVIRELRELGATVALDDFGAGMSSFSYLKSLTVDTLKIDGSFVRDILREPLDDAIVQSISKIARVRGIKTVAEFVEGPQVMMRLRELGVDYVQGFHLHRPELLENVI